MKAYLRITILYIFIGLVYLQNSYAQDKAGKSVAIQVTNEDGQPIEGVSVLYNEGASALKTDISGKVYLDSKKSATPVRIETSGYESRIIAADSLFASQTTKVVLKKSPFQSGEADLTYMPFGTMEKRRIVGAVNVLNPESLLQYDNNQDVLGAISGRVGGLYGTRDIRGLGTAVVVIDGIVRSAANEADRLNMVDELNLLEVEQISVLKDVSSKILYGAKADQGVILITTKRGTPFKRKLNVYTEAGVRTPISYPNYLSASDYMTLYNEALTNDGLATKYSDEDISNTRNRVDPIRYPDESFYNSSYLKDNSSFFKVITQASGGNEKARYFSSLGFDKSNSLYQSRGEKNSSSEQLNFRGNVDYAINRWISASLDAVAVYFANRYPNGYFGNEYGGNLFEYAATQLPNSFPSLIPIDQIQDPAILKSAKIIDGRYVLGGTNQFGNNILGNLAFGGLQSTQQKSIQFNSALKFDLNSVVKGLSANVNFTYDFLNSYTLRQNNEYAVYEPRYVQSSQNTDSLVVTSYGTDVKRNDQTINGNYFQRRIGLYGTVQYKNTFNSVHQIDAVALGYMSSFNIGSSASSTFDRNRTQHFGLRANYLFKNRYVAEISGVYVGSPYLSMDNRYAFSPSVGAAWILSEEDFLARSSFVNYFKLKSSYGILHSDNLFTNYRMYDAAYIGGNRFPYNDLSGNGNEVTLFQSVANPNLRFVKHKELNVGLESSILDNKIWLEANYFDVRSEGEPVQKDAGYPAYLGGYLPLENYNSTKSSGIDATLNYTGNLGKLRYTLGANVVYAVPRALKFSEPQYAYDYRSREGEVGDGRYGWVAEGLFKDAADIANHAVQTFGPVQPGDIKYKDLNDDGLINDDDQMQIGNSHARTQYGLSINLQYGNFDFFALGVGRSGSDVYYNDSYYWVYGQRKYSEVVINRWTPETAETATYPRLTTGGGSNNFRNSTYWLYSNDFFTLNTAQLTYKLPAKHFWKGIQLYVRGSNLFTISETRKQRELNIASSPQMRSYLFGIVGSF
jgi:TonB-linked SusC/RagA family outer membrane protein